MTTGNADALQKMLLQLRDSYLEEVPEKLDRLEELLLAIERGGPDVEGFNEAYRIVHSMKGSGGTHGLHLLTTICHQLEDLLNATEGGAQFSRALVANSLGYVDLLRLAASQYQADNSDFSAVEERLVKLRQDRAPKLRPVMLVDNGKLSTNLYRKILSELPVDLVVVSDGLTALGRALTGPFDLIVSTNEIPVLSGLAMIGALKLSDGRSRHTKTILITSNRSLTLTRNRAVDPDYTVFKDAKLADDLLNAAKDALNIA